MELVVQVAVDGPVALAEDCVAPTQEFLGCFGPVELGRLARSYFLPRYSGSDDSVGAMHDMQLGSRLPQRHLRNHELLFVLRLVLLQPIVHNRGSCPVKV